MSINKANEIAKAPKYPSRRLNRRERKVLEVSASFSPDESTDWAMAPTTVDAALDELAARATVLEEDLTAAEGVAAVAVADIVAILLATTADTATDFGDVLIGDFVKVTHIADDTVEFGVAVADETSPVTPAIGDLIEVIRPRA